MKNIFLLLACLVFYCCGNKGTKKEPVNDLKENGLKGNVRVISEIIYHLYDNYKEGKKTYYNKYGNITRATNYNNSGDSTASYSDIYDDKNYKILETGYTTFSKYTTLFKYDNNGNNVEILTTYDNF